MGIDTYFCIQIADLANEDTPQLYVACGRGPRSSLRVLRHGLEVRLEHFRREASEGRTVGENPCNKGTETKGFFFCHWSGEQLSLDLLLGSRRVILFTLKVSEAFCSVDSNHMHFVSFNT